MLLLYTNHLVMPLHALVFSGGLALWELLLRPIYGRQMKNGKITGSREFFICVINVGKDIFTCKPCWKKERVNVVNNLRG